MKLPPVNKAIKDAVFAELPSIPEPRWVLDIRGERAHEYAKAPAVVLAVDCHDLNKEGDHEILRLVLTVPMAAQLARKLDSAVEEYLYEVENQE